MKRKRPTNTRYEETHEWARASGKVVTIGITDFAVEQLGDITHVDLPKVGASTEEGAAFGEVDSIKTTADLICPVNGKVVEVNTDLQSKLDLLASDPYEEGWMIKVRVTDTGALTSLMTTAAYDKFLESEGGAESMEYQDDSDISGDDFA